jgi:uncharacterized protein (DUF488 family)
VTIPLYTIGHSTHRIGDFTELLTSAAIRKVVDVRSSPTSRKFPHFNREPLSDALENVQIGYVYCAALGGHRRKSKAIPPETNAFWQNQSFHNYADYAMEPDFQSSLQRLIEISQISPMAIMCAESVWWRCHRRIIADYLIWHRIPVKHIMSAHNITDAEMNPAAAPDGNVLRYKWIRPLQGTAACQPFS